MSASVLGIATDPDGRQVELTRERWEHIVRRADGTGHPELEPYLAEVLRAIEAPTVHRAGRRENERWYFLAEAGPSRWLQIVVAYADDRGWVVTAFARRARP